MGDRTKRKCRKCGKVIDPTVPPWVTVSLTGEENHYHKECNGRDSR